MPKKARSTLSLNSYWIILSIVAAVLGTAPLAASASTLIVGDPTGAGNCIPFGCNFWEPEYQQVYASTDFPSQLTITGLTFYNSGPFSSGFNGGTYTLALSSTSKAVNGLDLSNLSNNIGSDNKVVF